MINQIKSFAIIKKYHSKGRTGSVSVLLVHESSILINTCMVDDLGMAPYWFSDLFKHGWLNLLLNDEFLGYL